MEVISHTDAEGDLERLMDRVVNQRAPVLIARGAAEAVVMISLADWPAMDETRHLLWSPDNAERLRSAIDQLNAVASR